MKDFYSKEVHLTIYALISQDRYVFVGKTRAEYSLGNILSRHVCGRCSATRKHFEKNAPLRPQLYVLQRITATEAVGYKYILAYAYIFMHHGYTILNHAGTRSQLLDLHSETQCLVEQISTVPLEVILEQSYPPKQSTAVVENQQDTEPVKQNFNAVATERLSLRVSEDEKMAFTSFASELHMTQHEAFLYLLNFASTNFGTDGWQTKQYNNRRIKRAESKISSLEKEKKKLQRQLSEQDNQGLPFIQSSKIAFIKECVSNYLQHFISTIGEDDVLPTDNYRLFTSSQSNENMYQYPPDEGFIIFTPQICLLGHTKPSAWFICGQDEYGHQIKMRYYPKRDFIGPHLTNTRFWRPGTRWIVGARASKDQAMDMVIALPLSIQSFTEGVTPIPATIREYRPLDSVIADIEQKRSCIDSA